VLTEQWSEYIAQQLTVFASGERRNDVYAMRTIAPKLTQTEMHGLAAYYRAGFR
jgi:cytochrome c553